MKTEEIAEKARKYAERIRPINGLDKHDAPFVTAFEHNGGIEEAYIKGHEDCNAELQEKTRWIPVEERLPEENKQYLVIQLNDMKTIFVGRFNTISKRWSLFGYHDHVTHWREIIE